MITTSSIPTKNRRMLTREEIGLRLIQIAMEPVEDDSQDEVPDESSD